MSAYYSDANWDGTATLLRGGAAGTNIGTIWVENENASARFLQVFDAAAVADVTLGTTEPTIEIRIPATDNARFTPAGPRGVDFSLGVVIAGTTAARGGTTGGALNVFIEIL